MTADSDVYRADTVPQLSCDSQFHSDNQESAFKRDLLRDDTLIDYVIHLWFVQTRHSTKSETQQCVGNEIHQLSDIMQLARSSLLHVLKHI